MIIYEWNTVAQITVDSPTQWKILADALTAKSARPDPITREFEYEPHYWIVDPQNMGIKAGLVPHVLATAQSQRWAVQHVPLRVVPHTGFMPNAVQSFQPRDIQSWAAGVLLERTRGVGDFATNFGKTYMIADMWFRAHRPAALVLVPTKALLKQTSEDLAKLMGVSLDSIGKVGDGRKEWAPVTVGITNSVYSWINTYGSLPIPFGMLIADEGHAQVGDMADRVAMSCDAYYRFWLSGTAKKDNSQMHMMRLQGLAGPIIAEVRNKHMVEQGHSAHPHINVIEFNDVSVPYGGWPYRYQEQYSLLKHSDERNDLVKTVIEQAATAGLVTMCFVEHKDHQRELHKLLPWAEVVYGGSNQDAVRHKLEMGTTKCVITTSAWRLGVSTGGIDHLFHAGGYKSAANLLQEFGRVLRDKGDGINRCWMTDIKDTWGTFPAKWARQRMSTIKAEGFPVHTLNVDQVGGMFNKHVAALVG